MPGFQVSPSSVVSQIKANLRDRYHAGYPILKELLQNADDACARRFRVDALSGWSTAANPLLRGPGLLVANDGVFGEKDERGIISFGESSKAADSAVIGKFGIGQKAVFHLCDAFVVYAYGDDRSFSTVVNPFLNVEVAGNVTQEWEPPDDGGVAAPDLKHLRTEVSADFPDRCLVIWLPFRREDLQPAPAPGLGFSNDCPSTSQTVREFTKHDDDLRALLTMLRRLKSIEIRECRQEIWGLGIEDAKGRLFGLKGGDDSVLPFRGTMKTRPSETVTPFVGREATVQADRFKELQSNRHWPKTLTAVDPEPQPEKGEPHGAATLSRSGNASSQLRVSWAVFLPVSEEDDIRVPINSPDLGQFHLLLHGYFFLDSGRRRIEALTEPVEEKEPSDEAELRCAWNTEVRDFAVLPLVPAVLHDTLDSKMLTSEELAELVRAVAGHWWFRKNRLAICRGSVLIRVLEPAARIDWRLAPSGTLLRFLPSAVTDAPWRVGELFTDEIHSWADKRKIVLCVDESVSLIAGPPHWTPEELDSLFSCLPSRAFQSSALASLLADFLDLATPDGTCCETVGPYLVFALRKAMGEPDRLAPSNLVSKILAHVPPALLFKLPASVEHRELFRALAAAQTSILPVRHKWIRDFDRPRVSEADLKTILKVLEPLVEGEQGDEATTVALTLLEHTERRISDLAQDRDYADLKVLRAREPRPRGAVTLSLRALFKQSRDKLLFANSPEANSLLPLLADSLPGMVPMIVEGMTADFLKNSGDSALTCQLAKKEAVFALIDKARRFGAPNSRSRLLHQLRPTDDDNRSALRCLCTGAQRAGDSSVHIHTLENLPEELERMVGDILSSDDNCLIPKCIANELTPRLRNHLGISALNTKKFAGILEKNLDDIPRLNLTDPERETLLLTGISDSLIRHLPIHRLSDGTVGNLENVFREADWPIPSSLREYVVTALSWGNQKVQEKLEALVRVWSPESQIQTALSRKFPHFLWKNILESLEKILNDKQKLEQSISSNLRKKPWLVARNMPVKPEDVLALPSLVDEQAKKLFMKDGQPPPFWPAASLSIDVREHPGFTYLKRCVLPDTQSSFDSLALMIEKAGIVGRFGSPDDYPVEDFRILAKTGTNLKLPGWPLLAAVLTSTDDRSQVAKIVRAFADPSDTDTHLAARYLDALAVVAMEQVGNTKDAAERVYLQGFKVVAMWPEASRRSVFSDTHVPNMAGVWRSGREVIEGRDGVAPMHVLAKKYASYLSKQGSQKSPVSSTDHASENSHNNDSFSREIKNEDLQNLETKIANQQCKFLQDWKGRLPPDLVIIYLGLIGRFKALKQLAKDWESDATTDVDTLWKDIDRKLALSDRNPLSMEVDECRFIITIRHKTVPVTTLSGDLFEAPIDSEITDIIVGNLHKTEKAIRCSDGQMRNLIELSIRKLDPSALDSERACDIFRRLVETILSDCLYRATQRQAFAAILDKAIQIDQTKLEDTKYLLRDRLPMILAELKLPTECRTQRALRKYQQEEGRVVRVPNPAGDMDKLKTELWQAVSVPDAVAELLSAVRDRIGEFGYSANRVLFELYQNADDAYRQLDPVPADPCFRIVVMPSDLGGIRAIHWGRPINHLGRDPDEGRRLGHDRDLLNMLVMNFSEKRPEEDLTGKFGLGFKSVHMLSDNVGIASGFIALRTLGGFVPQDWPTGIHDAEELRREDGVRATVIDVPFSARTADDGSAAVQAFRASATWMLAFARHIRRIEITGDDPITVECSNFPLLRDDKIRVVTVSNTEYQRALRFDLGDDYSLLLRIGDAGPGAFENLRSVWNLAPLEEDLRSGWLLNGPFPVDPGRGRLAGSVEDQQKTFRELGQSLGERLLKLHDIATGDWSRFSGVLELDAAEHTAESHFWSRLFDIFSLDFDDNLARFLHIDGRGYAHFAADRPVVPTRLSQPFDGLVRASEIQRFTSGALSERAILEKVQDWPALNSLKERLIHFEVAAQLNKLGFSRVRPITLSDLLRHEMGEEKRVNPEVATTLGNVITPESVGNKLLNQERREILDTAKKAKFCSQDGAYQPVRDLNSETIGNEDEKLFCSFAPKSALLDQSYQGPALEFFKVARSESGYGPVVSLLLEWVRNAHNDDRRRAVLRYIIAGRQGGALAGEMRRDPPTWLPQPIARLQSEPLLAGWSEDDKTRLVLELGGDVQIVPIGPPIIPKAAPKKILDAIHEWWTTNGSAERNKYVESAYPEFFSPLQLQEPRNRIEWFTMFALACFQSLGRTQDKQHRSFIKDGEQQGWWKDLAESQPTEDFRPWLDRLKNWSGAEQVDQDFLPWRRTLVDLYTIVRWLDQYIELVLKLPRIVADQGSITLIDILRPSYAPVVRPLGLDAAPLYRSLGIGMNWMIRELLRFNVYGQDDESLIAPYCWMSSLRVRRLLNGLGADIGDNPDMDLSRRIYNFVVDHLDNDCTRFGGDFDLPLQLITLQRNRGALEHCFRKAGQTAPDPSETEDDEEETPLAG